MKATAASLVPLLATLGAASPFNTTLLGRDTAQTNDLGYAAGCMTSYNGIPFGFLPDYSGPQPLMGTINADTGKKSCTYGWYAQIDSTSWNAAQLYQPQQDIQNTKTAVFVMSVMPTGVTFAQVQGGILTTLKNAITTYTNQGVTVWLRFAHEVNYYVTDGTYKGGSTADFQAAWQRVHAVCAGIPKCLMFWSPNAASNDAIRPWWPGPNYVDIVGVDWYPAPGSKFADVYGNFYNEFSKGPNKHFVLGETGSGNPSGGGCATTAQKEAWLKEVTMADYTAFPNYQGANWFEYNKGCDFRVIIGQSSGTVTQTLSNFK